MEKWSWMACRWVFGRGDVAYFMVFFWHSSGNIEETHGIMSQVRWQQSRVSSQIPLECKSRKLSLRQPAGPPCSRDYVNQIQHAAKQGGKWTESLHQKPRSPSPPLPGGHTFPRCQDTKLYEPSCTERSATRKKKKKRERKCRSVAGQTRQRTRSLLTESQSAV